MNHLHLKNIKLKFPHTTLPIIKSLNLQIKQGDFIILLGSNGSGKSSLLKLIYKEYQPTSGEIYLYNKALNQYTAKELRNQIAVLTQSTNDSLFYSLTLYENYLLRKEGKNLTFTNHHNEREFFKHHIHHFYPKLANKLDDVVFQLSGGEKQILALALTFLNPPTLLLLDEHTSALDPKTSEKIMLLTQNLIEKHDITCILTTHDLDIALNYGNRILLLKEGSINKMIDDKEKIALTKKELIDYYS